MKFMDQKDLYTSNGKIQSIYLIQKQVRSTTGSDSEVAVRVA